MFTTNSLLELTNGNEQKVRELLKDFQTNLDSKITVLNHQVLNDDFSGLKETFHQLKSSIYIIDESFGKKIKDLEVELKSSDGINKSMKDKILKQIEALHSLSEKINNHLNEE